MCQKIASDRLSPIFVLLKKSSAMAESLESTFADELQVYFNDLKTHSMSYKLGLSQQSIGDEMQNPLHKQFNLILSKIEEVLAKHNKDSEEHQKIISMKASIIYEKAKILLAENLLVESKTLLEEALEIIKDYSEHPKVAFLHMRIVNHLTYVLSRLGQLQEAKQFLLKAIEDNERCHPEVFSTDDLFLNTKKDSKISSTKLTRLMINNMQMLAWIHARLGDTTLNLKMQHDILQKQLDTSDGDVLRWAESCFRLGGLFVGQGDWPNAMYHLLAAESLLNPLEVVLVPNPQVYAAQADLARTWIYYGLQLFEKSRKSYIAKELEKLEIDEDSSSTSQENDHPKQEEQLSDGSVVYVFQGLTVTLNENVPTSAIKHVNEAKKLFAYMQKWIKRARLFYTLRDYPLQYVNLCLDLSELYRFLALYEEDVDNQYAVQKRRYDALETLSNILKDVRPNCYVAVNVELTKELIEVQMELMNLNLKKLYLPPNEPGTEANEDTLRRQKGAFASIQSKLENVALPANTANACPVKGLETLESNEKRINDLEQSSKEPCKDNTDDDLGEASTEGEEEKESILLFEAQASNQ